MNCDEFQRRWHARQDGDGGPPGIAELAHIDRCEQCHALHESGELLASAITEWRNQPDRHSDSGSDREVTRRRQARLISQLTATAVATRDSRPSSTRPVRRWPPLRSLLAQGTVIAGGLLGVMLWWGHNPQFPGGSIPESRSTPVTITTPLPTNSTNLGQSASGQTSIGPAGSANPPPLALLVSAGEVLQSNLLAKATDLVVPRSQPVAGNPSAAEPPAETLLADLEPIRKGMGNTLDFLWVVSDGNSR